MRGNTSFPKSSSERITLCGSSDRKSTRLNSSHSQISYAVFCLKKKKRAKCAVLDSGQRIPVLQDPLPHPRRAAPPELIRSDASMGTESRSHNASYTQVGSPSL